MKPFLAWIALSSAGHPAFFLGIHSKKRDLKYHYSSTYGADLEVSGYTAQKVIIRAATSTTARGK